MDLITGTPKVILHTHLEGSIPSEMLYQLSVRNKVNLSFDPFAKNIYESIEAHNWPTFRKIYSEICSCFNTEDDFKDALLQYGIKLQNENVVYAEILFSPWKHLARGVSLESIARGFVVAIDKLENQYGVTIRMICDLIRHKDEECDRILDWLKELPKKYFVALGVSGGTNAVDRIHYKKHCEKAQKFGFRISAHAGEIEGAESVVEILEHFQVDRIGHGVRSIEDNVLLKSLIEKQIHFEICPTANKIIGLCSLDFKLISQLISMGINFSINPDDELIFNTTVSEELKIMISENVILENDIYRLQKNALMNSFADFSTKDKILKKYFND